MTLAELLDLAYTSEYIDLDNCDDIKAFAKCWKYYLTAELKELKISRFPHYVEDPLTREVKCSFTKLHKDSLKDEYKYLIE